MKQTRWRVITGAPCSGKTTVIRVLAERGFPTIPETARAYIDEELGKGRSLVRIKSDLHAFEREILMRKVRIERDLPADAVIFLDRGLPDSIAYYRLDGIDPTEPMRFSRQIRYEAVFHFDRLRFQSDPVRSENDVIADRLDALIAEVYAELGYAAVRVAPVDVEQRVKAVLAGV